MADDTSIFVGAGDADQYLLLKYGNRHGLIAGATGTGKTVTLQTLAEGFSAYGVPVFMADVKGDLSGISQAGGTNPRAVERAQQLKIEGYKGRAFPTVFWDLFGAKGHPVRTTVSEVGDVDKPKFVFFFDEAHLLFDDAPKALLDKIEQVVRLIRSKGVGVYFISQNPLDVPESVLGQLSNRVQHALRAFTPKDQKAVKTAADTFRPNKKFNAAAAIVELGVGEALVSFLDAKGVPTPVERCLIAPPRGRIGPATDAERAAAVKASPLAGRYDQTVDRESAYEVLMGRAGGGQGQ